MIMEDLFRSHIHKMNGPEPLAALSVFISEERSVEGYPIDANGMKGSARSRIREQSLILSTAITAIDTSLLLALPSAAEEIAVSGARGLIHSLYVETVANLIANRGHRGEGSKVRI
jgi:hypothetical protein